ncbi:MAG TPA: hypothetical protein VFF73_14365 [Planctomycetota bacterium]|nr:hypothetical protein [Planctomycetota bacterium]
MRSVALTAFLVASTALAAAVGLGWVDLLAIAPLPEEETGPGDPAYKGLVRADDFSLRRTASVDGAAIWSASGVHVEREKEDLYRVLEPRIASYRRGEATVLRAPTGAFGPLFSGDTPTHATLSGGVSLVGSALALETERLDADFMAPVGSAARGRPPRLETTSVVRGTLAHGEPGKVPALMGILAEGGLEARGDLDRLYLRGPVTIRDEAFELSLDASRDATVVLAEAPSRVLGRFDSLAGSLAGMRSFGRSLDSNPVVARLAARGDVRLEVATSQGERIEAEGDQIDLRLLEGTLVVVRKDGAARVAFAKSGIAVRAPWIFARDLGAEGTLVRAASGAVLETRLKGTGPRAPSNWVIEGEAVESLVVPVVSATAAKGEVSQARLARTYATTSPAHPGSYHSKDGSFRGTFSELFETEDEELVQDVRVRGYPLVAWSDESRVEASRLRFLRRPGRPDELLLLGDARCTFGSDVRAIAAERGVAPVTTKGEAWHAEGDRIALALAPQGEEKKQAFWEKSRVEDAKITGSPGKLDAALPDGRKVHMEGAALEADLAKGTLAAESAPEQSATVVLGSSTVTAKTIATLLSTGRTEARGGVRARVLRSGREVQLACERGTLSSVLDPDRRRELAREEKRPVSLPEDVVAFVAEEDVRVAGTDLALEADRVELEEKKITATRHEGRVHAVGREAELFARTVTIEDRGEDVRVLEAKDQVELAWVGTSSILSIASDRARALAFARDSFGKDELLSGPVVAWQEGGDPLRISSAGPGGTFTGSGRVLRIYPASGNVALVGSAVGDLTGKSGVPLHFEAPRVEGKVKKVEGTHRLLAHEASGRALEGLGQFEHLRSEGGVRARYRAQTMDARTLDYDGKSVRLQGSPVRVTDRVAHMDFETSEMRLDLDAPP